MLQENKILSFNINQDFPIISCRNPSMRMKGQKKNTKFKEDKEKKELPASEPENNPREGKSGVKTKFEKDKPESRSQNFDSISELEPKEKQNKGNTKVNEKKVKNVFETENKQESKEEMENFIAKEKPETGSQNFDTISELEPKEKQNKGNTKVNEEKVKNVYETENKQESKEETENLLRKKNWKLGLKTLILFLSLSLKRNKTKVTQKLMKKK